MELYVTLMAQPHNKMQIPNLYPTKQLDKTGRGKHNSTEGKAIPLHARTGPLASPRCLGSQNL